MKELQKIFAAGFAVFAMFFGAGNLVFPLLLGKSNPSLLAIIGFLLSSILFPLMGLLAMFRVKGQYKDFFAPMGKTLQIFLSSAIIALIGPFGALPRCLLLAHGAAQFFIPALSLPFFSLLSSLLIFYCSMKKSRVVDVIGYFLTPLLLFSLAIISFKGLISMDFPIFHETHALQSIYSGFVEGYFMMDLLAALFFSKILLDYFKEGERQKAFSSALIGMGLLTIVYLAFGFLGVGYADLLANTPTENLMSKISLLVLGSLGGITASIAIFLACLTTALALAEVSANFISEELFRKKVSKAKALIFVLINSFLLSLTKFSGIANFISPILEIFYPFLILLSFYHLFRQEPQHDDTKEPIASVQKLENA